MLEEKAPSIEELIALASEAGWVMRRAFGRIGAVWGKDDGTPVTEIDREINRRVLDFFARHYPHVRVIGEEGVRPVAGADWTVLCDPLDGTIPFVWGLPLSAFAITLLRQGRPFAAVVYEPFMDRLWRATRTLGCGNCSLRGVSCPGSRRCQVSQRGNLRGARIGIVWWPGADFHLDRVCQRLMAEGAQCLNPLTIAYLGGLVADGNLDATIFPGRHGWETAAMEVLVEEAGGRATDLFGESLRYDEETGKIGRGHIISNRLLHDDLVRIVSACQ